MQDSIKKAFLLSLAIGTLFLLANSTVARPYTRGNPADLMLGAYLICTVVALVKRELAAAAVFILSPFFFFAVRAVLTKWHILL